MSDSVKLSLGQIVATPGALAAVSAAEIAEALDRHSQGDWGDVSDEDHILNDRALINGSRVLSAYRTSDDTKFWLITEWDRSLTTVLLPEEY